MLPAGAGTELRSVAPPQKSMFKGRGLVEEERCFIQEASDLAKWPTRVPQTVSKLPVRGERVV